MTRTENVISLRVDELETVLSALRVAANATYVSAQKIRAKNPTLYDCTKTEADRFVLLIDNIIRRRYTWN